MAAPDNDTRATAETVSIGSYWGTLTGTTVEATEDSGGPFDGFDAQDVWYTWPSLPAGQVYFYVKPDTSQFIESFAWSSAPGDVTDIGDSIGGMSGFDSGEADRVMYQGTHTGGPLTLAVLTYVGDPGPIAFQVGWGHEFDPTPSHWGDVQSDPWVEENVEFEAAIVSRWGRCNYRASDDTGAIPPGAGPCVYENAADGVVLETATVNAACEYIGPDVGTSDSVNFDAGQRYVAGASSFIAPSFDTIRSDSAFVAQQIHVKGFPANFNAAVTHANTPATFGDYVVTDGVRDSGLGWGFEYHDAVNRLVRNLDLGEFTVANNYTHTPGAHGENVSVDDPCDVKLVSLPDSVLWPTFATRLDAEDRVWLAYESNGDTFGASATFALPETAASGDEIAALSDGATTVVIPDPLPYVHDFDGRKWLVTIAIAQQTMDETPPTFGDPTRSDDAFAVSYTADGTRSVVNPTADESYETRLPDWRPYLGFPLGEVPTPVAGWHVGREALSGSGPW